MKQHITMEQLWELCPNKENWDLIIKLNTLANIHFPNGIISHPTFNHCCETTISQMTIGKMIELLQNDKWVLKINQSLEGDWCVEINIQSLGYYFTFSRAELVDALWQAIKFRMKG